MPDRLFFAGTGWGKVAAADLPADGPSGTHGIVMALRGRLQVGRQFDANSSSSPAKMGQKTDKLPPIDFSHLQGAGPQTRSLIHFNLASNRCLARMSYAFACCGDIVRAPKRALPRRVDRPHRRAQTHPANAIRSHRPPALLRRVATEANTTILAPLPGR